MRLGLGIGLDLPFPGKEEWIDPLAAYSFPIRIQCHRGNNDPDGLLFQDALCTVPAYLDGHIVQGFRHPVTAEIIATQTLSMSAPVLRFTSGVPSLDFGDTRVKFATFVAALNATFRNVASAQIWVMSVATSAANSTIFWAGTGSGGTRINLRTGGTGGSSSALAARLDSADATITTTVSLAGGGWRIFGLRLAYSAGNAVSSINATLGSPTNFNAGAGNSNNTSSSAITMGRNTGGPSGNISSLFVMQSIPDSNGQTAILNYLTSLGPQN